MKRQRDEPKSDAMECAVLSEEEPEVTLGPHAGPNEDSPSRSGKPEQESPMVMFKEEAAGDSSAINVMYPDQLDSYAGGLFPGSSSFSWSSPDSSGESRIHTPGAAQEAFEERASRPGNSRIPGKDHRRYYHNHWRLEYLMDFNPHSHSMICMVCGSSLATLKLSTIKRHIRQKHPYSLSWTPCEREVIIGSWDAHLCVDAQTLAGCEDQGTEGILNKNGSKKKRRRLPPVAKGTWCHVFGSEHPQPSPPDKIQLEQYMNESIQQWLRLEFLMDYDYLLETLHCMMCVTAIPSLSVTDIKHHILDTHPTSLQFNPTQKSMIIEAWINRKENPEEELEVDEEMDDDEEEDDIEDDQMIKDLNDDCQIQNMITKSRLEGALLGRLKENEKEIQHIEIDGDETEDIEPRKAQLPDGEEHKDRDVLLLDDELPESGEEQPLEEKNQKEFELLEEQQKAKLLEDKEKAKATQRIEEQQNTNEMPLIEEQQKARDMQEQEKAGDAQLQEEQQKAKEAQLLEEQQETRETQLLEEHQKISRQQQKATEVQDLEQQKKTKEAQLLEEPQKARQVQLLEEEEKKKVNEIKLQVEDKRIVGKPKILEYTHVMERDKKKQEEEKGKEVQMLSTQQQTVDGERVVKLEAEDEQNVEHIITIDEETHTTVDTVTEKKQSELEGQHNVTLHSEVKSKAIEPKKHIVIRRIQQAQPVLGLGVPMIKDSPTPIIITRVSVIPEHTLLQASKPSTSTSDASKSWRVIAPKVSLAEPKIQKPPPASTDNAPLPTGVDPIVWEVSMWRGNNNFTINRSQYNAYQMRWRSEYLMDFNGLRGSVVCMYCCSTLTVLKESSIKRHIIQKHPHTANFTSQEKSSIILDWETKLTEIKKLVPKQTNECNITEDLGLNVIKIPDADSVVEEEEESSCPGTMPEGKGASWEFAFGRLQGKGKDPRKYQHDRWKLEYLMDYTPTKDGLICMVCGVTLLNPKISTVKMHIQQKHPDTTYLSDQEKAVVMEEWEQKMSSAKRGSGSPGEEDEICIEINEDSGTTETNGSGVVSSSPHPEIFIPTTIKTPKSTVSLPPPCNSAKRNYQVRWRTEFMMDYDCRRQGLICMVCGGTLATLKVSTIKRHIVQVHPYSVDFTAEERQRILEAYSEMALHYIHSEECFKTQPPEEAKGRKRKSAAIDEA